MNRRSFLLSSALVSTVLPSQALAKSVCSAVDKSGQSTCQTTITFDLPSLPAQHGRSWAWAACIQMIFRYYGHDVAQERIVKEMWGKISNLPARPHTIIAGMNRQWEDENGRPFSVSAEVCPPVGDTAYQDISQSKPMIIATMGPAMVLTSLHHVREATGSVRITSANVQDPTVASGQRVLTAREWLAAEFVARIRVS